MRTLSLALLASVCVLTGCVRPNYVLTTSDGYVNENAIVSVFYTAEMDDPGTAQLRDAHQEMFSRMGFGGVSNQGTDYRPLNCTVVINTAKQEHEVGVTCIKNHWHQVEIKDDIHLSSTLAFIFPENAAKLGSST